MTDYHFVTIWQVAAPLDQVWEAIYHSEKWPSWWRGVIKVEDIAPGDAQGIGHIRRYTWRSQLPYNLVFDMRVTRIDQPHTLEGQASGELEGTGKWTFRSEGELTIVQYNWDVRTTKAWMNWIAPLARPFFAWNHDVVMGWGGEGLGRLLNTQVIHLKK